MRRIPSSRQRSGRFLSGWPASVAGWLVCAAAATAVGTLAVTAIGSGITGTGTRPLGTDEVEQQLAARSASPEAPVPTSSTSPSTPSTGATDTASAGVTRVIGSQGGSVVARCVNGTVELVSFSPGQGYEIDDLHPGPARSTKIQFESDDLEINILVTCVAGIPTGHITTDDD